MCIICNILCFDIATAISNFDSETCNTPPKRLWKGRAGKKCQDLRQCGLKVSCRCTKQCIIRIPQLHRIRIWTESWNLKDYDTRRAFMYQLIERKPVHGNNEHRKLDYTKYWIQKYWIIQKNAFSKFCKIECFVCAQQYDNYRSGIILCVFAWRYLYVYIFLEYVLNEIYIIMSQSTV